MFEVKSYRGSYAVQSISDIAEIARSLESERRSVHLIIDTRVQELHGALLEPIVRFAHSAQTITATESNKDFDQMGAVIERLLEHGVRRDHLLLAVGGGIIEDITCFVASVLFRGVAWDFLPTTLLAQADSCIGSKSSINFGKAKNLIGTFFPPRRVWMHAPFLKTLTNAEMLSGLGEILKVHILDGPTSYDRIADVYDRLLTDPAKLQNATIESLKIKRRFIETDEFDTGVRNLLNYGHSFGHAIEAATDFKIPHGIAITIGMDVANWIARERGLLSAKTYDHLHRGLKANFGDASGVTIPLDAFFAALSKDKKNTSQSLQLILLHEADTGEDWAAEKTAIALDDRFRSECAAYFKKETA